MATAQFQGRRLRSQWITAAPFSFLRRCCPCPYIPSGKGAETREISNTDAPNRHPGRKAAPTRLLRDGCPKIRVRQVVIAGLQVGLRMKRRWSRTAPLTPPWGTSAYQAPHLHMPLPLLTWLPPLLSPPPDQPTSNPSHLQLHHRQRSPNESLHSKGPHTACTTGAGPLTASTAMPSPKPSRTPHRLAPPQQSQ